MMQEDDLIGLDSDDKALQIGFEAEKDPYSSGINAN
jgi:hypothetical protein